MKEPSNPFLLTQYLGQQCPYKGVTSWKHSPLKLWCEPHAVSMLKSFQSGHHFKSSIPFCTQSIQIHCTELNPGQAQGSYKASDTMK